MPADGAQLTAMTATTGPASGPAPDDAMVTPVAPPPASPELLALRERWMAAIHLRRELVVNGWTDAALRRAVKARALAQPRRGGYTAYDAFVPLDARGRHAMTTRTVLMQAESPASASHGSALIWYGAPDYGLDLGTVDTTRHDGRAGRREAGVVQHRGVLVQGDLVDIMGVSVMSPTRGLLELTSTSSTEVGLVHANHLLFTGQTTLEDLRARFASMREWPGTLNTDIVLRLADARIQSLLESLFDLLCCRNSIPRGEPQYQVRCPDTGALVAQLDFAWPERGRYVELDGKQKYGELLRPGQQPLDVLLKEKERDKLVKRITGMECDRFTYQDVDRREAQTVARLRVLLNL